MNWTSKQPPEHIREGDIWIKEPDYSTWFPNFNTRVWNKEDLTESIPFPKKTKIYGSIRLDSQSN